MTPLGAHALLVDVRWLRRTLIALGLGLLALGGLAAARGIERDLARPLSVRQSSFVGSAECRRCHAPQYESWARTFHRTMTQEASQDSVLGAFDGSVLRYRGVEARMRRSPDGRFLIAFARGDERWEAEVVRTVGSHRYQQYLALDPHGRGNELLRLPVAWNVVEGRFIHMNGAFLTSDPADSESAVVSRQDYERHVTRWNDNCVYCHNVGPQPGLDPGDGSFTTHVAELGIACEACHGPGSAHVDDNGDPLRRYALHLGRRRDPTIANPLHVGADRSAEICGRCHGQRITDDIRDFHLHGDPFVPGDSLWEYSRPLARTTPLDGQPGVFAARFWRDGTPRLTAYEYQGLLQSPCYERGQLTCESCHAMHESDPAGQLHPALSGDAACTQCHRELATQAELARHSGHEPSGPGARCRGCHMPDIVYGLTGMRISHRIEIPDPGAAARDGRPDACTLCHADRPRAWAVARSGQGPHADVLASGDALPETARMVLGGDPIERATAAHALGNPRSPAAVGPRLGLLLDVMEHDDYPAVRAIAWGSLRRLWPARAGPPPGARTFTATDRAGERAPSLASLRSRLGAAIEAPEPGLVARHRAHAAQVAIQIGE